MRRLEENGTYTVDEARDFGIEVSAFIQFEKQFREVMEAAPLTRKAWTEARDLGLRQGLPRQVKWPGIADLGNFVRGDSCQKIGMEVLLSFSTTYGMQVPTALQAVARHVIGSLVGQVLELPP